MPLLGPFKVGYPVAFKSGGDTTRVAFGKHIQEIEKIYGILNALDADKLSASDLSGMLSGFKPAMSFNDISGSLDMSRITGNLDGSRISGQIAASKIYGNLSNATIDAGKVNGLSDLIISLAPTPPNKGDGITDLKKDENGYILFNNGFMFQWGKVSYSSSNVHHQKVSFSKAFPNKCINIFLTVSTQGVKAMDGSTLDDSNLVTVKTIDDLTTKSEFYFGWNPTTGLSHTDRLKMRYLAVGY